MGGCKRHCLTLRNDERKIVLRRVGDAETDRYNNANHDVSTPAVASCMVRMARCARGNGRQGFLVAWYTAGYCQGCGIDVPIPTRPLVSAVGIEPTIHATDLMMVRISGG